jgi:hypothetical protein
MLGGRSLRLYKDHVVPISSPFVIKPYPYPFERCRVVVIESEKEHMNETKQIERNMQNINAQNDHSSYCECIWCVEELNQPVRTSDLAKREVEQEMTAMLKDLPLPITIQKDADLHSNEYIWQCMGTTGKAYSFVDATRQALSFITVSR